LNYIRNNLKFNLILFKLNFPDLISINLILGEIFGEAWLERVAEPMGSERSDHVTASTACRVCKVREWMAASQSVPTFLGERTSPFPQFVA
jgi:hypothetical protein